MLLQRLCTCSTTQRCNGSVQQTHKQAIPSKQGKKCPKTEPHIQGTAKACLQTRNHFLIPSNLHPSRPLPFVDVLHQKPLLLPGLRAASAQILHLSFRTHQCASPHGLGKASQPPSESFLVLFPLSKHTHPPPFHTHAIEKVCEREREREERGRGGERDTHTYAHAHITHMCTHGPLYPDTETHLRIYHHMVFCIPHRNLTT
jgi:hypothetical protein